MDWNQALNDERRMLKGIAGLLFSLAALAELVADRALPVRGFVLWLLRRAEAVVQDFALDMAEDLGAYAPPAHFTLFQPGNSPADAMRLSRRLRKLAGWLDRLTRRHLKLCKRYATRSESAAGDFCLQAAVAPILAAIGRFLTEAEFAQWQPCPAPVSFAIERLDSS